MNKTILPSMTIGDVVKQHPQTAQILLGYGLQCVGCAVNPFETIEQGALGHGMTKETIDEMLADLNLVVTKKPAYPLHSSGITLSPRAVVALQSMAKEQEKKEWYLRVQVKDTENGLDYFMDFTDQPLEDEQIIEQAGIRLCVNDESLMLLFPSIIDYVDRSGAEGFKFIPLKEEERCACDKPMSQCGCNGQGCSKDTDESQTGCGSGCGCA